MLPPKSFTGERIYLRGMTLADATETYASWLNDPEVNRFLATKSATVPELESYIEAKIRQPDAMFFGMFLREGDIHIGTIKLEPIDFTGRTATIAIMIGNKAWWGKGIGGEAMTLLIRYCFDELHFTHLSLGVIGKNDGAIRAYEKLGFKEIKREPNAVQYGDEIHDQVSMVLTNPTV